MSNEVPKAVLELPYSKAFGYFFPRQPLPNLHYRKTNSVKKNPIPLEWGIEADMMMKF